MVQAIIIKLVSKIICFCPLVAKLRAQTEGECDSRKEYINHLQPSCILTINECSKSQWSSKTAFRIEFKYYVLSLFFCRNAEKLILRTRAKNTHKNFDELTTLILGNLEEICGKLAKSHSDHPALISCL